MIKLEKSVQKCNIKLATLQLIDNFIQFSDRKDWKYWHVQLFSSSYFALVGYVAFVIQD